MIIGAKNKSQQFLAAAVREFYSDLADVKHDDKALKFAKRCHEKYFKTF